eukprot:m.237242 g.237242  ORF g.237242 m.237242 type:complete len:1503 (+) comp40145_c0_seq34:5489-9997(+)
MPRASPISSLLLIGLVSRLATGDFNPGTFTAAVASFVGCDDGPRERSNSTEYSRFRLRFDVVDLLHGVERKWNAVEQQCRDDKARRLAPRVYGCDSFEPGGTYIVAVAENAGGDLCLVAGERLPRFRAAGRLTASSESGNYSTRAGNPVVDDEGRRRVKRSDRKKHIRKYTARETVNFLDDDQQLLIDTNVVDGRIDSEVTVGDGKQQDMLRLLLLPSLWTVHGWLAGMDHGVAEEAIKNGATMTSGDFVATTVVTFYGGDGGTVRIVQQGGRFEKGMLAIRTTVVGKMPSGFSAVALQDVAPTVTPVTFVKVNRTTLESVVGAKMFVGETELAYGQVVTVTTSKKKAFKGIENGMTAEVNFLMNRRALKSGKLRVSVDATLKASKKQDLSGACCERGIFNAHNDRQCGENIRQCRRSTGDICCSCCKRGRDAGLSGEACRVKGEKRTCRKAFVRCCQEAAEEKDRKNPTTTPLPSPSQPKDPALLSMCCYLGALRAKYDHACSSLLPTMCGTAIKDCCRCCQNGERDAGKTAMTCTRKGPFELCRNARRLCCEHKLNLPATTAPSPAVTPPSPKGDLFLVVGNGSLSGSISHRRVVPAEFSTAVTSTTPGVARFLLLTPEWKDPQLLFVLSLAVAPIMLIRAPESGSENCPNVFYKYAKEFRISVAFSFQDRPGSLDRLEVRIDGTLDENGFTKTQIAVNGTAPRAFESPRLEGNGYEISLKKENARPGRKLDVVYVGKTARSVTVDGVSYVFSQKMKVMFKSDDIRTPLPSSLTFTVEDLQGFVTDDLGRVNLILSSSVSTKGNRECNQGGRSYIDSLTEQTTTAASLPPFSPSGPIPVEGSIKGSFSSLSVVAGRLDGWFNPVNGTYDVELHLGDVIPEILHSSMFVVPAVSTLAWLTAQEFNNRTKSGWRHLGYGTTLVTDTTVNYPTTNKQLSISQTAQWLPSGSLGIETILAGNVPRMIFPGHVEPVIVLPSASVVSVGDTLLMAADGYEMRILTDEAVPFHQMTTLTLSGRKPGNASFAQELDFSRTTVTVHPAKGTIRVQGRAFMKEESPIEDACCRVGQEMARSGQSYPAKSTACTEKMRQCYSCCIRGKDSQRAKCRSRASDRHCKKSYLSCCEPTFFSGIFTLPPLILKTKSSPLPPSSKEATPTLPSSVSTAAPPPKDSCSWMKCSQHQRCAIHDGRGHCSCPNYCSQAKIFEECCASDNSTYAGECFVKNIACRLKANITYKYAGKCNPSGKSLCSCNGYSETCDSVTGVCSNCRRNTAGRHCNVCKDGFYGSPQGGNPLACRPCPCPGTADNLNNFSAKCHLDRVDGEPVCDACDDGYMGRRCHICADGYYGQPKRRKGQCRKCTCSGNVDPQAHGICDRKTGRCHRCLFNTDGKFCHRCKTGYFGDAVVMKSCRPCACNTDGAVDNVCDHRMGVCNCKEGVGGDLCDHCLDGYWGFGRNPGAVCQKCNCCSEGSEGNVCDQRTGVCQCKKGYFGRNCCEREKEVLIS